MIFGNATTSGVYQAVPSAAAVYDNDVVARRSHHDDARDHDEEKGAGSTSRNNKIELTAVTVATTPTSRMVVEQEGHGESNGRSHHDGDDDDSYEERCVWTDTHFDHHRPGMIQAVFDHHLPAYFTGETWCGSYCTLLFCTAGGTAFSLYVLLYYDYYYILADERYWGLIVVVFFLMLVAVIACCQTDCLEKRYPSRIISHTALTCSGIRHELVPEEFATKLSRPCVIKIPYSEIATIRFAPGKNTDRPESMILQVVTKSTDDETKYIGSGIPLRNHTFVVSGYPTKEVALNLYGLMEPYRFKQMVLRRVAEEARVLANNGEAPEVDVVEEPIVPQY